MGKPVVVFIDAVDAEVPESKIASPLPAPW
jgi:hypothetical protein